MDYEQLISKLDEHITKMIVIRDILRKAPKLNIDAKLVAKSITHIDIDKLDKLLDNI